MSTLKTVNIQHPSSSTPSITMDSTGAMTGSFPYPNRNLLYNGAIQVAQRGTSTASITTSGYYTADRWNTLLSSLGTWTQSVETDGPTGSGLTKSLKYLCTTASASPAAASYFAAYQTLEGQDVQRVAKGTASAQQLTLSFWVKSNKTGTYVAELRDVANTRTVSASYSISASATWEKKTITFPADTTGTLANDNTGAFQVYFWLAAGSDYTSGTLATTWASTTAANRAVGQTNLAAAINNYWQITGVQLETGPVATPFEFKSYGQELRECQRYFQRFISVLNTNNLPPLICPYGHNIAALFGTLPVILRTPVAATLTSTALTSWQYFNTSSVWTNVGSITMTASDNFIWISFGIDTPGTGGSVRLIRNNFGATQNIDLNAEL